MANRIHQDSQKTAPVSPDVSTNENSWSDSTKLSKAERLAKILRYKQKLFLRRQMTPISKKFSGRSKVASQKLRVNGKFVKAQ